MPGVPGVPGVPVVSGVPCVYGVAGAYTQRAKTALMNRLVAMVLRPCMLGATLHDACTDIIQIRTYSLRILCSICFILVVAVCPAMRR